jgi:hypothetical protein
MREWWLMAERIFRQLQNIKKKRKERKRMKGNERKRNK